MPETAALSAKRNPGSRLAAGVTRVETTTTANTATRLPRCVQRRLPCVPVPGRCHPRPSPYRCADYRVPRRPYRLPVGLSAISQVARAIPMSPIVNNSCPDRRTPNAAGHHLAVVIGAPRCKKSASMMDLSLPAIDANLADLESESGSTGRFVDEIADRPKDLLANIGSAYCSGGSWTDATPTSESEQGEVGAITEDPTARAASVVCHVLVLNAWRRRRAEITQLEQQVEHLHLQIEFLRRLLLAENERVGRLNSDLHRERTQLDDATRERDAVKSEKEKLQADLKRVDETSQERSVTIGNLRNDLVTAQDQLKALDAQMAKDREKLLKLREDKKILLDKVSASEALATERGARAERAESVVEELQIRSAAQVALTESAQDQLQRASRELQAAETQKQRLEERLKVSEDNARALSLRTASLESRLAEREAELCRIESECSSQMAELSQLRERLLRQSEESGWSGRILQIAGNIMRASILRTFAFISSAALP